MVPGKCPVSCWYLLWIESCPTKKITLKFSPPVPKNVTLFGNKAITDVISYGEVILSDGPVI